MAATPRLIYLQGTAVAGAGATGNGSVISAMDGYGLLTVEVAGTFTGTVTWEGSIDGGTTWFGVGLKPMADTAAVLTATTAGVFKMPADVLLGKFRARLTWSTGAVTVRAFVLTRTP